MKLEVEVKSHKKEKNKATEWEKALMEKLDKMAKSNKNHLMRSNKNLNEATQMLYCRMKEFQEKVEILEETILSIYHNIKQNQFLYSYEPQAVLETFEEIRKKILDENAQFKKVCNL